MSLRILLVRHGLSSFNLEHRIQGRDDLSSLTVAAGKAFSIVFDNQDTHEGATPM